MEPLPEIITIGQHIDARGVGDAILLTGLIRELKEIKKNCIINVLTTSPASIFENNPKVNKLEYGIMSYSINKGEGHYFTRKCRYFGIEIPPERMRGELFFTDKELHVARATLELLRSHNKQPIIFCMNSTDNRRNWDVDHWVEVIKLLESKYDVYQVEQNISYSVQDGSPSLYKTVPNARQELRNLDLRKIMAIQAISLKYLGSNTGFYHISHCFGDDTFTFMHKEFAGNDEWVYPTGNYIWNDESFDQIKERVTKQWMN